MPMRKPRTMRSLEELGRFRLSSNFFMRDFLYSEIANFYGIPNIPDDPDLAVAARTRLCEELLEPIQNTFGRIGIRSGYRSAVVTTFGHDRGHGARLEGNAAYHTWDIRGSDGQMGAAACIVIPWFVDKYEYGTDWRRLAWWIHDHLPYCRLEFYPKLCAFNIQWCERPIRRIDSFIDPRGCLTKSGMSNHNVDHSSWYKEFPQLVRTR